MGRKNETISRIDLLIGQRIRALRTERGIFGKELSEAIGVSHQQLMKYENGVNHVSAGRLLLIARAMDKPVEHFYNGLEQDSQNEKHLTDHQKMCMEVSSNFIKLRDPTSQKAVHTLIRSLVKQSA